MQSSVFDPMYDDKMMIKNNYKTTLKMWAPKCNLSATQVCIRVISFNECN